MDYASAAALMDKIECSSLESLRRGLLVAAVRYAGIRAKWCLESPDGRRGMDAERTRAHDALIDACNILSRNQAGKGEDNTWRVSLGDDRKVIGDFACYVHCILGVRAR